MANGAQPWSPEEFAKLHRYRHEDMPFCDIARLLGRSVGSVRAKLLGRDRKGPRSYRVHVEGERYQASQHALAERELRCAARDRQTLTQSFCGDPPPGFSALERR